MRLQFYFEKDADEILLSRLDHGCDPLDIRMPLNKSETDSISVIREVMVGPQKHSAEARRAVQHLLARNGLADVEVNRQGARPCVRKGKSGFLYAPCTDGARCV